MLTIFLGITECNRGRTQEGIQSWGFEASSWYVTFTDLLNAFKERTCHHEKCFIPERLALLEVCAFSASQSFATKIDLSLGKTFG